MAERSRSRQVEKLYSFDRLGRQKIAEVYQVLVREDCGLENQEKKCLVAAGDVLNESSGYLRPGIV